jgi:hypothetical protein
MSQPKIAPSNCRRSEKGPVLPYRMGCKAKNALMPPIPCASGLPADSGGGLGVYAV